ncbi:hypothetical protein BB558_004465 [Smittium angustum]|uniref:PH domain-containing protein n=1 Tax=Smittium angustum TaxID=133377 RepID=A0A2U1J377_SMIAN|nr:hypothetical protein BB558_004465 [Smittium angustum]
MDIDSGGLGVYGFLNKKNRRGFWQERVFVLDFDGYLWLNTKSHDLDLLQKKNLNGYHVLGKNPKLIANRNMNYKKYDISKITKSDIVRIGNMDFCINVGNERVVLQAKDKKEAEMWISHLEMVIDNSNTFKNNAEKTDINSFDEDSNEEYMDERGYYSRSSESLLRSLPISIFEAEDELPANSTYKNKISNLMSPKWQTPVQKNSDHIQYEKKKNSTIALGNKVINILSKNKSVLIRDKLCSDDSKKRNEIVATVQKALNEIANDKNCTLEAEADSEDNISTKHKDDISLEFESPIDKGNKVKILYTKNNFQKATFEPENTNTRRVGFEQQTDLGKKVVPDFDAYPKKIDAESHHYQNNNIQDLEHTQQQQENHIDYTQTKAKRKFRDVKKHENRDNIIECGYVQESDNNQNIVDINPIKEETNKVIDIQEEIKLLGKKPGFLSWLKLACSSFTKGTNKKNTKNVAKSLSNYEQTFVVLSKPLNNRINKKHSGLRFKKGSRSGKGSRREYKVEKIQHVEEKPCNFPKDALKGRKGNQAFTNSKRKSSSSTSSRKSLRSTTTSGSNDSHYYSKEYKKTHVNIQPTQKNSKVDKLTLDFSHLSLDFSLEKNSVENIKAETFLDITEHSGIKDVSNENETQQINSPFHISDNRIEINQALHKKKRDIMPENKEKSETILNQTNTVENNEDIISNKNPINNSCNKNFGEKFEQKVNGTQNQNMSFSNNLLSSKFENYKIDEKQANIFNDSYIQQNTPKLQNRTIDNNYDFDHPYNNTVYENGLNVLLESDNIALVDDSYNREVGTSKQRNIHSRQGNFGMYSPSNVRFVGGLPMTPIIYQNQKIGTDNNKIMNGNTSIPALDLNDNCSVLSIRQNSPFAKSQINMNGDFTGSNFSMPMHENHTNYQRFLLPNSNYTYCNNNQNLHGFTKSPCLMSEQPNHFGSVHSFNSGNFDGNHHIERINYEANLGMNTVTDTESMRSNGYGVNNVRNGCNYSFNNTQRDFVYSRAGSEIQSGAKVFGNDYNRGDGNNYGRNARYYGSRYLMNSGNNRGNGTEMDGMQYEEMTSNFNRAMYNKTNRDTNLVSKNVLQDHSDGYKYGKTANNSIGNMSRNNFERYGHLGKNLNMNNGVNINQVGSISKPMLLENKRLLNVAKQGNGSTIVLNRVDRPTVNGNFHNQNSKGRLRDVVNEKANSCGISSKKKIAYESPVSSINSLNCSDGRGTVTLNSNGSHCNISGKHAHASDTLSSRTPSEQCYYGGSPNVYTKSKVFGNTSVASMRSLGYNNTVGKYGVVGWETRVRQNEGGLGGKVSLIEQIKMAQEMGIIPERASKGRTVRQGGGFEGSCQVINNMRLYKVEDHGERGLKTKFKVHPACEKGVRRT